MSNKSNTVIVAVGVALTAIVAILLVTSLSSRGGGGGGTVQTAADTEQTGAKSNTVTSNTSSGNTAVSDWATGDYQTDLERLRQELSGGSSSSAGTNTRDAAGSTSVLPAQATYNNMEQRSMGGITLFADFDLSGNYLNASEVDRSSREKYPSYVGSYYSEKEVLWQITINDGCVFATPIGSANEQITRHVILSEVDHLIQYDGVTNQYVDLAMGNLPVGTIAKQVVTIDKATLDSYSVSDIEAM